VTGSLVLPYFVLWATLMKALLVKANIVPPSCARCGHTFERRELGEPVCRCAR
jgi:predicted Zn-ribbon and HTH transcriptional regulator